LLHDEERQESLFFVLSKNFFLENQARERMTLNQQTSTVLPIYTATATATAAAAAGVTIASAAAAAVTTTATAAANVPILMFDGHGGAQSEFNDVQRVGHDSCYIPMFWAQLVAQNKDAGAWPDVEAVFQLLKDQTPWSKAETYGNSLMREEACMVSSLNPIPIYQFPTFQWVTTRHYRLFGEVPIVAQIVRAIDKHIRFFDAMASGDATNNDASMMSVSMTSAAAAAAADVAVAAEVVATSAAPPTPSTPQGWCRFAFNHVIATRYVDGSANINAHSDKTKDIAPGSRIVSLSFGGRREFVLTDAATGEERYRFAMPPGSLFVLGERDNVAYKHAVVTEKEETLIDRDVEPVQPSISLAMRRTSRVLTPEQLAKKVAGACKSKAKRDFGQEKKRLAASDARKQGAKKKARTKKASKTESSDDDADDDADQ
jgi:alkylated DNA repair dioxygenase AlkB